MAAVLRNRYLRESKIQQCKTQRNFEAWNKWCLKKPSNLCYSIILWQQDLLQLVFWWHDKYADRQVCKVVVLEECSLDLDRSCNPRRTSKRMYVMKSKECAVFLSPHLSLLGEVQHWAGGRRRCPNFLKIVWRHLSYVSASKVAPEWTWKKIVSGCMTLKLFSKDPEVQISGSGVNFSTTFYSDVTSHNDQFIVQKGK